MTAKRRCGFALVELAAVLVTLGVLLAVLVVAAPSSRHMAWQAGSIANLHEYAAATAGYSADYADRFWSYSWRFGEPTPSQFPDLREPPVDAIAAAAAQAVDILRRRASRPDMPRISDWLACHEFSHLVLADYLESALPLRFAVSPGDRNRGLWSNDIAGFDRGDYVPTSPDPRVDPQDKRWPYSSSYRVPLAFFAPDALTQTSGTIVPSGDLNHFQQVGSPFNLGERLVSKVPFPSQKVFVFDMAQWQGVKQPVFGRYAQARVPLLLADGSARVRATAQANQGFQPSTPRSPFPTMGWYTARPWDPPVLPGVSALGPFYYYETRAGIRGRDFDGQEVSTSDWN